jgi:hypothetical protein
VFVAEQVAVIGGVCSIDGRCLPCWLHVVYINETKPKRPGSRNTKKVSKPQKPTLSLRWLEPNDDLGGPGAVYEWFPNPENREPLEVDIDNDCLTGSIICKVAVTTEVDAESGVERQRIQEGEASRVEVVDNCGNDGNASSDSSDGVDEELRVEVAQPSVEITCAAHSD